MEYLRSLGDRNNDRQPEVATETGNTRSLAENVYYFIQYWAKLFE